MTRKRKILLIYTGGTIGMVKDYTSKALKAFDFSQILENIPELKQLDCEIASVSFEEPIDSSNMNTEYYVQIAEMIEHNYEKYDGFVVLTGSDTMSYISSAISFMLEYLKKPVIFTGSQLPIGYLRTDAKENLITSIEIASAYKDELPVVSEVCLYFEYKLYRANRTTKLSAEQFEAFASMNYPPLAESGVHLNFNKDLFEVPTHNKKLIVRKNLCSDIAILKLFPGISLRVVESVLNIKNIKGIILETYGAGNAPSNKGFIKLISNAIGKGIYIVNVTQCVGGSVLPGHYETSSQLKEIGVIDAKDMTTESALAKLMYLLGIGIEKEEFSLYYEQSLRGEITNK
ncbi:asparaginase [Flavobacteriaceae bacterium]|nr:asparaginase [Flavobacteriaceae bacterium]